MLGLPFLVDNFLEATLPPAVQPKEQFFHGVLKKVVQRYSVQSP